MDEPLVFLHLSDIHFNKKWHDHYELDSDLRDQLGNDVAVMAKRLPKIRGVLISGDIAFSGKKEEYDIAFEWLKGLCSLAGCREQDVWCVPGNHDVDRSVYESSKLLRDMHDNLRPQNPDDIDDRIAEYLRDKMAAPLLFEPLARYNDFAAKFGCASQPSPLAWHQDLPLNDGSVLRVYGINSTLASDKLGLRNG
jgi:3',5'-cyclic AMP phosphodiesterase CpdA